jgi:hypothetical protein
VFCSDNARITLILEFREDFTGDAPGRLFAFLPFALWLLFRNKKSLVGQRLAALRQPGSQDASLTPV